MQVEHNTCRWNGEDGIIILTQWENVLQNYLRRLSQLTNAEKHDVAADQHKYDIIACLQTGTTEQENLTNAQEVSQWFSAEWFACLNDRKSFADDTVSANCNGC